jgi:hypothetical protein
MHCIVPFAAPASDAGRAVLGTMQWPRLAALLPRLSLVDRDEAEPTTFSPPHERVLARALGWATGGAGEAAQGDGRWPLAARALRADGIDPEALAWGLVTPVHWHVGTDQVSVADPAALQLDDAASRALFTAVRPLFVEAAAPGESPARFEYGHATRWYVAHESLEGLRTASLDRVVGRNVDRWLDDADDAGTSAPAARRWRRLQAEVQMLLHAHPLNAERERRGLLPINSFWLSGCGRARPEADEARHVQVEPLLRAAAVAEDWPAWQAGWRRLEEGTLLGLDIALRRGNEVWLTLAGERAAATFAPLRGGIVARARSLLARPSVSALLATL